MHSNKRICIRVAECLSVEIENDLGEWVHGVTIDISNQGIGVCCSTDDRNRITPQGDFVKQGRPVEVQVYLKFPDTLGLSELISVRCGIVYSRKIAQDQCQVGMYFLAMDANTEVRLTQFIQNRKLAHRD
ncbi:MAG: PilZ domain-containing protein [Methyloprofundus sp.]|nr:PilZ domain-containing protein [Methyloprofundus sp.]MDT8425569.1 PilZ domain-containing protein [Methyloprofundus sp.]